jgi:hypothetical protein
MKLRVVIVGGKAGPWIKEEKWRSGWEKVYGYGHDRDFVLLAGWLHMFLWGMSMGDRALMLRTVLGREVRPEELNPGKAGLKGWEDFPDDYKAAPMRVEVDG